MSKDKFIAAVNTSYTMPGASIYLGAGILEGEIIPEARVNLSLRMMNRHGLVTGGLPDPQDPHASDDCGTTFGCRVAVFMPDMKGDLSGFCQGREPSMIRSKSVLLRWGSHLLLLAYPLEIYSLSGKLGAQMRATVTEFGPVLLSKVLELNEVQSSVMMILFKYTDDKKLPIVDLQDLKKVLNYLSEGEGSEGNQRCLWKNFRGHRIHHFAKDRSPRAAGRQSDIRREIF